MPIVQSGLITENRERRHIADPTITPIPTALYTDLYHVDSAYVAWKTGQMGDATFDLYTRKNPFAGGFMLVAGLEPALDYLRAFKYTWQDREYLQRVKGYEPEFLEYLRNLRFTGRDQGDRRGRDRLPERDAAAGHGPLSGGADHRIGTVAIGRHLHPDRDQGRPPDAGRQGRDPQRLRLSAGPRAVPGGPLRLHRRLRQHLVRGRRPGIRYSRLGHDSPRTRPGIRR